MKTQITYLATLTMVFVATQLFAQKPTTVNLGKFSHTFNRNVTSAVGSPVMKINAGPGSGGAWLRLKDVANAEIEVELKGSDSFQRSFVGIAFHGQNDSTYEAIYFRPFNFGSSDPERAKHTVQYISLPGNDWPKLRSESAGKYEQPLNVQVNPNDWFKVKIVLLNEQISVYINGAADPSLQVKSLSTNRTGKIGMWTGNESAGEFRNMTIKRLN